ncbi:GGDEF domain-containing protein [Terriglobus roseus]|uniref:Diguanylate cyclase n=1 Tax=Terriglobus roseus TaxID=392734 RepID=A0A1H4JVN5_9BACT|nr:GGDEF domain-containing protein [Terriglobus roseus]SEB50360.1 diguanylate cyclase [Terriglobus roseus]
MMGRFRSLFSSGVLPEEVLGELVDLTFTSVLPIVVMGSITTGAAILIGASRPGIVFPALAALALFISALRILLLLAYRRRRRGLPLAYAEVKQWQRRYAIGSYSYAALLGTLNFIALRHDDSQTAMLSTGLLFGYCAGLVARNSIRPAICLGSMALAVIPTVVGLAAHFDHHGFHRAAYVGQAVLILVFALTSVETVAHQYSTTIKQLVTKRVLASMVRQDDLTGMPNRLSLRDRFEADIVEAGSTGNLIAVHALDLDRFKQVNDGFGHPTGDALLQAVAKRLRNTLKPRDTAVRMGGDEFVLVQTGINRADEARALAHRVLLTLSQPYTLSAHEVHIGVSIGIALLPNDGMVLDVLLDRADAALYKAKREGRNRIAFWSDDPSRKMA